MLVTQCQFQQEIGEASDDAARKYYDDTPKEDKSDAGVTAAMRLQPGSSINHSRANSLSIFRLPTQSLVISSLKRLVFLS